MPLFTNSTLVPPPKRRRPQEEEEFDSYAHSPELGEEEETVGDPPLLETPPPTLRAGTEGMRIPSLEALPSTATPRGAPGFSGGITLPPRPRSYDYEETLASPPKPKGWRKVLGTALEFSGLPRFGEMVKRPGYQEDLERKGELRDLEEERLSQEEKERATRAREEEARSLREWREESSRESQETREKRASADQRKKIVDAARYDVDSFVTEEDAKRALEEKPDWYQPKIHKIADPTSGDEFILYLTPKGQMATRGVRLSSADVQVLRRNGITLDPEATYLPAEAKAYHDHALAFSRREGAMETTSLRGFDAMERMMKMIGNSQALAAKAGDRAKEAALQSAKMAMVASDQRILSAYDREVSDLNAKRDQMSEEYYFSALNSLNSRHHADRQSNMENYYGIFASLGEEWAKNVPQVGPPTPVLTPREAKERDKKKKEEASPAPAPSQESAPSPVVSPPQGRGPSPPPSIVVPGSIQEEQQILQGPRASDYLRAKGMYQTQANLSEEQARKRALDRYRGGR